MNEELRAKNVERKAMDKGAMKKSKSSALKEVTAPPTSSPAKPVRILRAEARALAAKAREEAANPLLALPDKERSQLFAWLRECPYNDAVQHILKDQGVGDVSSAQLSEFFQLEAESHWEQRIERAAFEANALVELAEKCPGKFSGAILAALGQEAFRQIASGNVEPDAMGKIASLFLKARNDERADQMQELKREKLRHDLQDQVDHALEKLAEEVDRHPAAREAFEALRKELSADAEQPEEAE
jgi:hypothetical protein